MSRLLSELRRKSVYVHLVVLVLRPWSDSAFNHVTHRVHRFAFPDADAEAVIVGSRMDWQRNVRRKPSFHRLSLGGLEALGVVNSVDDCHKHGFYRPFVGLTARKRRPIAGTPDIGALRCVPEHHLAATDSLAQEASGRAVCRATPSPPSHPLDSDMWGRRPEGCHRAHALAPHQLTKG
jgi:hypothetical protein